MKYESMSIRKAVKKIEEKELFLPHIQRKFVWKQDRSNNQVKRFFDTIMREYPFGTLLFWITDDDIQIRRFIENYRENMDIRDTFIKSGEYKNKRKTLVLDGQQRLQALYIALKGTYNGMELYFDVLSGQKKILEGQDEFLYNFDYFNREEILKLNNKFIDKNSSYWFLLKNIVLNDESSVQIKYRVLDEIKSLQNTDDEIEKIVDENISKVKNLFNSRELIYYYRIDSTLEKRIDYEEILEIFIRTNSGGTALTKSDLMFSLIKLSWEEAEEEFERLLNLINQQGTFRFDKDFILKTALVIIGKKARYEVKKFKGREGEKNLTEIQTNWEKICSGFKWLIDILHYARITSSSVLPSYNALIPIIYYAYIHDNKISSPEVKDQIKVWLYKALLNGNFSGQSDGVIDACTNLIEINSSKDYFPYFEIESEINRKLNKITEVHENIIDGNINLVLNLSYFFNKEITNFNPLLRGNTPELDHIFPRSIMLGRKYKKERDLVNNIGNYMFLEKDLNISKTNKLPDIYFKEALEKKHDFYNRHFIPSDPNLHKPENFEQFVNKRREIILNMLKKVLVYRDGKRKRLDSKEVPIVQEEKADKGRKGWTILEIYKYLDDSKTWRKYTYLYFKILAEVKEEIGYNEIVKEIQRYKNEFDGRKFGGVHSGITRHTNKKGKERLDIVKPGVWTYSLNEKYRDVIINYFKQR